MGHQLPRFVKAGSRVSLQSKKTTKFLHKSSKTIDIYWSFLDQREDLSSYGHIRLLLYPQINVMVWKALARDYNPVSLISVMGVEGFGQIQPYYLFAIYPPSPLISPLFHLVGPVVLSRPYMHFENDYVEESILGEGLLWCLGI